MIKEEVEVLVIGAGPSGCVASAYLNQQGIKVKVVEKTKFPRPVIGESLIPRVMEHFDAVGIIPDIEKAGFEIKRGARFIRGKEVCVFDFSQKFTPGWSWTWQVPRADFDLVVANAVQKQGVEIEFETEVTGITFEGNISKTIVRDKKGNDKEIKAEFVIDSSGFGRVLPKLLDLEFPSSLSEFSSIFTHVKDVNRPNHKDATLITFDVLQTDVWLWVIPFSNGNTSLGVVGPTKFIESLSPNNDPNESLRNILSRSDFYKDRFASVDFLFDTVMLKNYSCSVKKLYGEGFALTGNSSEFLDPVFSSGVAFATESGMQAAKLTARQIKGETVNWEKEYSEYMKEGINVFSTYVKEWYTGNLQKLFFHEPGNPEVKKQICAVLAGYVWDKTNPFVKKHERVIVNMAYTLDM